MVLSLFHGTSLDIEDGERSRYLYHYSSREGERESVSMVWSSMDWTFPTLVCGSERDAAVLNLCPPTCLCQRLHRFARPPARAVVFLRTLKPLQTMPKASKVPPARKKLEADAAGKKKAVRAGAEKAKLVKYDMRTKKGRVIEVVRKSRVPLLPDIKKKLEKLFKTWEKIIVTGLIKDDPHDTRRVGKWRLALTKEESEKYAKECNLTEKQVRKWFANRRRRQAKLDAQEANILFAQENKKKTKPKAKVATKTTTDAKATLRAKAKPISKKAGNIHADIWWVTGASLPRCLRWHCRQSGVWNRTEPLLYTIYK